MRNLAIVLAPFLSVFAAFTACSTSSSDPTPADAGAEESPCFQFAKDGKCLCESVTFAGDGGPPPNISPVAECSPQSQGPGTVCCATSTYCECSAPYEVRCRADSLGNCRCKPDVHMDSLDQADTPVDKCTPKAVDGGAQAHCCKFNEGDLLWPSCRCSLSPCETGQTDVAECFPGTVVRPCSEDKQQQVATCKGGP